MLATCQLLLRNLQAVRLVGLQAVGPLSLVGIGAAEAEVGQHCNYTLYTDY